MRLVMLDSRGPKRKARQPIFTHEPYDEAPHNPAGFLTDLSVAECYENGLQTSSDDIPDGTYVKNGDLIRPDAKDSVGGMCRLFILGQYWPPDETRWMTTIHLWLTPPGLLTSHSNIYGLTYRQDFDSRVPNTTLFGFTYVGAPNPLDHFNGTGTWEWKFQGESELTGCNFERFSAEKKKTLNAVNCGPRFIRTPNNLFFRHLPYTGNGPINVYVPTQFDKLVDAFTDAIPDVNTALDGTGIAFHLVDDLDDCSGPRCVVVDEDQLDVGTCAGGTVPIQAGSGGIGTEQVPLFFTTGNGGTLGWSQSDATVLRRTAAHELLHTLGMDEPYSSFHCALSPP